MHIIAERKERISIYIREYGQKLYRISVRACNMAIMLAVYFKHKYGSVWMAGPK